MKLPQRRDQVTRRGYAAIAQLAFPCLRPAMPGNGCSGHVDDSIDLFRPGVEESGLRIPEHMWQLLGGRGFGPANFRTGAKQSSYIVTLMTQVIHDGRSNQAR